MLDQVCMQVCLHGWARKWESARDFGIGVKYNIQESSMLPESTSVNTFFIPSLYFLYAFLCHFPSRLGCFHRKLCA